MLISMSLSELITGSDWLGSPWLRIQAAQSSTSLVALPFEPGPADFPPPLLPLAGSPELWVLPVGKLATPGELGPWLHAASAIPATAAKTTSPPGRRHVLAMSHLPACPRQAVDRRSSCGPVRRASAGLVGTPVGQEIAGMQA